MYSSHAASRGGFYKGSANERFLLVLIKILSRIIRLRLELNTEYVIYRAKLARHETNRKGINLSLLKDYLIFIEDRSFMSHKGINWRGLARAVLGLLGFKKRSGGSSITQQISRTLFIVDMHKTFRRKFVEIMLSKWIEKIMSKVEILEVYLSAVRYDSKVNGISAAICHFFGTDRQELSKAEAFFLIERISNIRSGILFDRITSIVKMMINKDLLTKGDAIDLREIYKSMVCQNRINLKEINRLDGWLIF